MVEVYRTNITENSSAEEVTTHLMQLYPDSKINFDLEDCDHVLRVECSDNIFDKISAKVNSLGYFCEVLE